MSVRDEHIDVSVLVPTFNEKRFIAGCAERMRSQTFDGTVELLFIDGRSDDGTREFLYDLARRDDCVHLLDNPARRTPNALNLGLAAARGEFVARMDAHTFYPPEYLAAGVRRLRQGGVEWVSGPALPLGVGRWSRWVALGMQSPIAIGGATFRRLREAEFEVDTGFTGLLRGTRCRTLGGWDEGWPINQDGELAGRFGPAGQDRLPSGDGCRTRREGLPTLAGAPVLALRLLRVKTSRRHPASLRRTHLLAPVLVATLLHAATGRGPARTTRLGSGVYLLVLLAAAARMRARADRLNAAALPVVWGVMHLAWGGGFIAGCARMGVPLAAVRACLRPRRRAADQPIRRKHRLR